MPSWIVPSDSHIVGDTGHTTDHNHVADDLTLVNSALPVVSGGLTGAVQAARFAGATTSGAPVTGTFAVGDFIVDQSGTMWLCTAAGSPGTWTALVNRTATETISGLKTLTGKLVVGVASGDALIVSSDGTKTSAGAIWFNPASGTAGGMNMKNTTDGFTYTIIADILGLPASTPAIAGYGGGWVFFSQGSGSGSNPIVAFGNSSSTGPGGANGCALTAWTNSKLETLKNVLDDGSTGASTWASTQNLAAGTATAPPVKHQSGSLLTTAAAGAQEFDGTAFYATAQASSRQVVDTEQFCTLTSPYTLTSQTAAQKLFNSSANGAVTVQASVTYWFECFFTLSAMSASSGAFGFALGGTATLTSQVWETEANKATLATAASAQNTVNTAANTAIVTATTATVGWAKIWGKIRVNAGGTLIPQVSLGVAAAAAVGADSYFRIWPAGASAVTSVGNWS